MTRPRRRHMLVAGSALLVACSGSGDQQSGAISTDEARQVNAAAEMLANDSVALNAVANDQDQP